VSPYLRDLADFLAAYAVILATPGPNMLLVGGVAATSGIVAQYLHGALVHANLRGLKPP
jgi:threonine/homoserine/homoserine lactone efflux protein